GGLRRDQEGRGERVPQDQGLLSGLGARRDRALQAGQRGASGMIVGPPPGETPPLTRLTRIGGTTSDLERARQAIAAHWLTRIGQLPTAHAAGPGGQAGRLAGGLAAALGRQPGADRRARPPRCPSARAEPACSTSGRSSPSVTSSVWGSASSPARAGSTAAGSPITTWPPTSRTWPARFRSVTGRYHPRPAADQAGERPKDGAAGHPKDGARGPGFGSGMPPGRPPEALRRISPDSSRRPGWEVL